MLNYRLAPALLLLLGGCQQQEQAVPLPAATADFTYAGTLENRVPLQFTSTAPDATSYQWNFGDGTTSTDANPIHSFRRAGSYSVQLRASGTRGTADVAKTLVLAQADTLTPIMNQVAGNYRFKVIQVDQMPGGPITMRRVRDTTLTVTSAGARIGFYGLTMNLIAELNSRSWPRTLSQFVGFNSQNWPAGYYRFRYQGERGNDWAEVKFQNQGDSLILARNTGSNCCYIMKIFYGKRIP